MNRSDCPGSKKAMTKPHRILLCIGCDAYDFLDQLNGAQHDASEVFSTLTDPVYGDYPSSTSRLLLSPTLNEVFIAIDELMPPGQAIDTLTLFFAGHGGVSRGSYYLCLRDAVLGRLSTTSFGLSRLFEIINEKAPAQCNIILDSCQSGGLVADLGALLKPELLGTANTSGVSIFATSAANEYSIDTHSGGLGTTQLLRVLRGELVVQSQQPFLDLVEVGRIAANGISQKAAEIARISPPGEFTNQSPVVWGLNLFGQSRFTRNPHYQASQPTSVFEITSISPASSAGLEIGGEADKIWSLYYMDPNSLTPQLIFDTLSPIVQKLGNEADLARFVRGLATTLKSRVEAAENTFAAVEVLATCISMLLHRCRGAGVVESAIVHLAQDLLTELDVALGGVLDELNKDEKYLAFDGLADFFYLPIRLHRILGWAGAALVIANELGLDLTARRTLTKVLAEKLIDTYTLSLGVISDEQTPYCLTFLFSAFKHEMREQGEAILGLSIAQFCEDKGRIARTRLPSEQAYDFMGRRIANDFESARDLLAQPSEALSMLLLLANVYEMEETVDPYLHTLDHVPHFIFIPESHIDFSEITIHSGRNHNFQIGHGIWSVEDIVKRWGDVCNIQLKADASLKITGVRIASLCSALIFPNRSPWFLLRSE